MGDWNITIRGTGAHHNKNHPKDANKMARAFVEQLKEAGHYVKSASFTHGGEEILSESLPQSDFGPLCRHCNFQEYGHPHKDCPGFEV